MACARIRDTVRANVIESRQINRDKVLGSKRKALQDVVNVGRDVTAEEVVLIGNKLKNKSSIQIEDLSLLELAFVQNACNIVAFLKVKGALHALVRELSSSKSKNQLLAAECCCNLALGSPKSCLQVAKAAGPYLIALLSGCNHVFTEVSVWALGNLVGSDQKTWKVIHAQGFLGKLLQMIQEHDTRVDLQLNSEIQQNSFSALVQFLYVGLGAKLLTEEEIQSIARTISNLSNSSGKGLRVSEFLLSCIEAAEKDLLEHKVHLKCVQFLDKSELTDDTVSSFTPAVRTIANLVTEPSGACCLDVFANWSSLQGTIQKVFSSPYSHLVEEVGWLLGNLMNHSSPEVQRALQDRSFDFQLYTSQFAFLN